VLASILRDLFLRTDGFIACYASLLAVVLDEFWLVVAGCDLPCAVLVGVHPATHHESLWSAAIVIIALLGVV
jgi:hypothetical protein